MIRFGRDLATEAGVAGGYISASDVVGSTSTDPSSWERNGRAQAYAVMYRGCRWSLRRLVEYGLSFLGPPKA